MEVENSRFDVAVIGAGPGGSTLAALLASRGLRVALIDRDSFPRDKLCGEFLSYDALPLLETLGVREEIESAGANPISTCRVVGKRRAYSFPLPAEARGISRLRLDHTLLRKAGSLGATLMEGWTVDSIDPEAEAQVLALKRKDGTTLPISATVVAGAWGRWGRLDQQLKRSFVKDHEHRHFGFKRHYASRPDDVSSAIDLYSFRDGYLGVSGIEGNRTNICGLVHGSRLEGHKGGWPGFVEKLVEESPELARLFRDRVPAQEDFLSSEPVIFASKSAVVRGVLMVGDASGLVDPLAGNGMAMAIQSAFQAAIGITHFLRGRVTRSMMEAQYAGSFRTLFAGRIRWSRRIAHVLSRPGLLNGGLLFNRSARVGSYLVGRTRATEPVVKRLIDDWSRAV